MTRRVIIALCLAASLVLGLAAVAGARSIHRLHVQPARHRTKASGPSIRTVVPLRANVGDKLTIGGKGFKPGKNKNTVFFYRSGGGVASAKAEFATKTRLVVTIPDRLTALLRGAGPSASPTRFRLRVLSGKFGKPTKTSRSPVIGAAGSSHPTGGGGGGAVLPTPDGDCNGDGVKNKDTNDDDGDLITDLDEINVTHTDPCKADTDGDGVGDGFEYYSALDMNNTKPFNVPNAALPYPGKRPWPNPLDSKDADTDHDGDGLTMADEFQLFKYYGQNKLPLNYSAGLQASQYVPAPGDVSKGYMDMDGNGILTDDERDADNDGVGNWDERYGRLTQDWWDGVFNGQNGLPKETRYPNTFPGTSMTDPDSDGDGVLDGLDDQDHDGLSNGFELARPPLWNCTYVSTGPLVRHDGSSDPGCASEIADFNSASTSFDIYAPNPWARVQPYNPCKPVWSKTCHLHWVAGYYPPNEDWQGEDGESAGTPPAAPWLYGN